MVAGQPVVVVEDHDGADDAAGHDDHDAGEVGPDQRGLAGRWLHVRHNVHEEGEGHEDRDLQRHLLAGVRGEVEPEDGHA